MNYKSIYIGSLLAMALLASCNNTDKAKSGESESTISGLFGGKDDKNKASEIINFNNSIVKVDNSQNSAIQTFANNFDSFEKYVKGKVENPEGFMSIPPIMMFPPTVHNLKSLVYPDGLSKEFKPLIDQMNESFDAIKEINKEVDSYKSAEDWKEDKGQKLVELREKATTEIKKYRDASTAVFAKLKPLAEKAEETTLEGNPLKDQYVGSKKLLELVQNTTNIAFETEDQAKLTADFKKQYQDIEKLYKENKDKEIPKDFQPKIRTYGMFNDDVNDFLGKMRIAQRELDANTPLSEDALRGLDNAAESVLRSYNAFVD
ncbi:DUF3829 domain-containing protein [Sphingobacterium mizutaii]|uniref:DUF3829 domain-containing protein n=1 Tax=Sphingobacterium mizutaii TaxID=1010 RepID=UPI0016233062|nr:DUF3829 domain-containing protein [Sphingobacterium mizutaii]